MIRRLLILKTNFLDSADHCTGKVGSNTFHEFKCKSLRYTSSFFPDAITSWNNVITHFGDIPSFNVLKNHILSLIRPKKKCIFGIHDPLGLRYIFQLRVGLSHKITKSQNHKITKSQNRRNFIDTPSDICLCNQGIEDTNHFLFLCPFFVVVRATLAINVIAILQKCNLTHLGNKSHLCLYGHHAINFADNRKILLSTIEYIKKTIRF